MLAIKLPNGFLDLLPGSSVNFTLLSPYFDRDKIERSFSYPLSIPASPNNLSLLGYQNRLDARKQRKIEKVDLYLNGIPFERGVLLILDVNETSFEVAFQNESLDLTNKLQEYKLQDLSLPIIAADPFLPKIYLKVDYDAGADGQKKCYIEINGLFFSADMPFKTDIVATINTTYPGLCTLFRNEVNFMIIYLDTAIKNDLQIRLRPALPDDGIEYKFFSIEALETLAEESYEADYLNHLDSITTNPTTHTFPVIYAPELYSNVEEYLGYINYYEVGGSYGSNDQYFASTSFKHALVPMVFLKTALEEAFKSINITLQGDFLKDPDIQKLIIYNQATLDGHVSVFDFILDEENLSTNQFINKWNGWKRSYNLANHLPDLNYYEFLQALTSLYPLLFTIKNGIADISTVNALLSQTVMDLSAYLDEAYTLEYSEIEGYKLSFDRQGEDEVPELANVTSGSDPFIELTSTFYTLEQRANLLDQLALNERFWSVPFESGKGKSDLDDADQDIPLKLLFYLGLQNDNKNQAYPKASFSLADGTSLAWEGRLKYWSKYIKLLMGDAITLKLNLPIAQLIHLKNKITAPIYLKHPMGNIKGVIKELRFELDLAPKSIIACETTIVRL